MPKLTKRAVEKTTPDPSRDQFIWDNDLAGFGLRVYPTGRRVYIAQYRTAAGNTRRQSLGQHGIVTTEQARRKAQEVLSQARLGQDPGGEKRAARTAPTMTELCARYLEDHARERKKSRGVEQDKRMIDRFILPSLGHYKVGDVSRQHIVALHHGLRRTPYQANRLLALLSKMMNLAERWGVRPENTNPCRLVEKFKEKSRGRYLNADELQRLGAVLEEAESVHSEDQFAIAAIRLLLLTGARKSEILELKWDYIDWEHECLRLPDSKTGAKIIYLPSPAVDLLRSIEQQAGNPFVLVGHKPGAHLVNLSKPWGRIRETAGLSDVRLHDLRHTFAGVAVSGGQTLPMIGALLGHTQPSTTARYARLADDPLKVAANQTAATIASLMQSGAAGHKPQSGGH